MNLALALSLSKMGQTLRKIIQEIQWGILSNL